MKKNKFLSVLLSASMLLTACAGGGDSAQGSAKGNNGDIEATVNFKGDKIDSIDLVHNETEGLGDQAAVTIVDKIIQGQTVDVDTVSGATNTSEAVIAAVTSAIESSSHDIKNYQKKGETADKEKETKDYDVVVVGGGGAGFAAAISAKEAGANVVLVEKLGQVGGNTLISGGEYAAPANELQEKEGIEDSVEQFEKDVEKAGGNKDLIKVLAENATDGAHWLRDDIGVEWLDSLMFFGGHSVKRSFIPKNHTGNELISNYKTKAEELGIDVLTNTDVKEILTKDGKVSGVRAESEDKDLTLNAKSVVLASGGFGANAEMCYENDKEVDEHVLSTNSPGATGDGIVMAEALGADTVDMDKIQLYPICDVETGKLLYVGDTRLVGGALLVNKEGKRFVEELDTRRAISMGIKEQTDHVGYLIWDEKSNEKTGTMKSNPEEAESLYERGLLYKADTIEELADHFEIDKEALLETVNNFNENSKKEQDPEFNLRMLGWTIDEGPYYMLKAGPAVHHTMGGLKINPEAEVQTKDGKSIEGLYAAGEVTGGIHGSNRLGSVAMADITVFGRIAGENAAEHAKN